MGTAIHCQVESGLFFWNLFLLDFGQLFLDQNFGPFFITATIAVTPFLEREWLFSSKMLDSLLDSSWVVLIGPGVL